MRRHIYYYTHLLDGNFELLEERFRGDPAAWLPAPAALCVEGWLVDLHADGVLLPPLALQRAELQVSLPSTSGNAVVRSVSWHASRADRLFPVFAGDLELAPLPVSGWQLSLLGTYRPPLSVVGGTADRMLGHRVAEACVRRFVLDVADRLAPATLPM
jgi:hypothetical protein